jgi:type IV pilus assembly protein PilM
MKISNKLFPRLVGIDIGSASIKVVELAKFGKRIDLKNYAHLESATYDGEPFRAFEKETLFLSSERAAEAIKACFESIEVRPKKAVFSLPDFSSFFVSFDLPKMSENELTKAINFHASKYVPIPMNEIILDWQKVETPGGRENKEAQLHILGVAIPKVTMDQYRQVADLVGISNFVLEPEAFSLFRVFAPENGEPLCLIDLGAKSTTLSFGSKSGLQSSHSLDVSSDKMAKVLEREIGLSADQALAYLQTRGLNGDRREVNELLSKTILPLTTAFNESWGSLKKRGFSSTGRPAVLLAGGMAMMPGMKDYLSASLNTTVGIGNPFRGIEYPRSLSPIIQEIGPSFSVAIGTARRNF